MPTNTPAPGWFPDQSNSHQLRWWDGSGWTDQTRPLAPDNATVAQSTDPGRPKKPWYFRWWAIAAAVLVALAIVGSLTPDEETPAADATTSQTSTSDRSAEGSE